MPFPSQEFGVIASKLDLSINWQFRVKKLTIIVNSYDPGNIELQLTIWNLINLKKIKKIGTKFELEIRELSQTARY